MGLLWSRKAVQRQKDINRLVSARSDQGQRLPTETLTGIPPTLVRALVTIGPNQSGLCAFLRGRIGAELVETGQREVMWNVASEGTIKQGSFCLAHRVAVQGANEWVVIRGICCGTEEDNVSATTVPCDHCDEMEAPGSYDLEISGATPTSAFVIPTIPAADRTTLANTINQTHTVQATERGCFFILKGENGPNTHQVSLTVGTAEWKTSINIEPSLIRIVIGVEMTVDKVPLQQASGEYVKKFDSDKIPCKQTMDGFTVRNKPFASTIDLQNLDIRLSPT